MLESLVNILPPKWRDKAKAIVVAFGALVGILTLVVPDSPQWLTGAVFVATALGVYKVPNVGYGFRGGHWDGITAPKRADGGPIAGPGSTRPLPPPAGPVSVTVPIRIDGREIHEALLRYKRGNGGGSLGLD